MNIRVREYQADPVTEILSYEVFCLYTNTNFFSAEVAGQQLSYPVCYDKSIQCQIPSYTLPNL